MCMCTYLYNIVMQNYLLISVLEISLHDVANIWIMKNIAGRFTPKLWRSLGFTMLEKVAVNKDSYVPVRN